MNPTTQGKMLGLRTYPWRHSYKTSITRIEGRPLDMLHDFYVPALQRAVLYDRVAGYFRSTSLAAASQGYSQFVNQGGKMRLIVGADLEIKDVTAILEGDSHRLEHSLNSELEDFERWPEAVQNGVALLSWMVAQGSLELRVAFRVNGKTGKALAYESVADGYVHEKWMVLQDEEGNRLYAAGTLNESKTGLMLNAENIDVHCSWWGEIEVERINENVVGFESLWNNREPHMLVISLPEAVRQKLISFADRVPGLKEIDGTPAQQEIQPPTALERLTWAVIKDAPKMPLGRYVGMVTAPVEAWPHQKFVVRRLIETYPYSYLLCDEVGLGKTIEAALAMRALFLSGIIKRILIAAPAGLTRQWHRQLASKVLMPFGLFTSGIGCGHEYIHPDVLKDPGNSIFLKDLVIVSTGLMQRYERAKEMNTQLPYDVILVDEAHALRRKNTNEGFTGAPEFGLLYKNAKEYLRKSARSFWMATATPMQLEPVEVCDLLAFTDRVGSFQMDPSLTWGFYRTLQQMIHDESFSDEDKEFMISAVKQVQVMDIPYWHHLSTYVLEQSGQSTLRRFLEQGRMPISQLDKRRLTRFVFSSSPLSRVMMRHTRPLLEIYREKGQLAGNLAKRQAKVEVIAFTEAERKVYDLLESYCVQLQHQLTQHRDSSANRQMLSFLLSFLRVRFASSFYAIQQTLKRRLAKVEMTLRNQTQGIDAKDINELRSSLFDDDSEEDTIDENLLLQNRTQADLKWELCALKELIAEIDQLPETSTKLFNLLGQIQRRKNPATGRIEQTVLFTRFFDTLTDILNQLKRVHSEIRVGTYSGQGASWYNPIIGKQENLDREQVKEKFLQGEIDLLLCTDAAAEGLNLQTANLLINFDLGWNPMKIEQRIGRIDRIGQKYDEIYVLNYCYAGSVEEIVYGRLQSRLAGIMTVVGSQQISIVPVEPSEFEELSNHRMTVEELEELVKARIVRIRQQSELMETPPKDLYDIYERMESSFVKKEIPLQLVDLWGALSHSTYLKQFGLETLPDNGDTIRLKRLPDSAGQPVFTISRDTYENGIEGQPHINFFSYGDPQFDRLIQHITDFELPSCVRRVSIKVPEICDDYVAYAVVCRNSDGERVLQIVRGVSALKGLELFEGETVSDHEAVIVEGELRRLAIAEFEQNLGYNEIVRKKNVEAAVAQRVLNLLIMESLIDFETRHDPDCPVKPIIAKLEAANFEHCGTFAPDLNPDAIRKIESTLLFKVSIMARSASINAPQVLGQTAIDEVRRVMGMFHESAANITASRLLQRMRQEIKELLKQIQI